MQIVLKVAAGVVASLLLSTCGTNGSSGDSSSPTTSAVVATTELATTTVPASSTSTTSATTTTTVPAPTSPTFDELEGASIPGMCTHESTTLVDGKDPNLEPQDGVFELQSTLRRDGSSGTVEGIPSEAGPLTAIVATCNAGGVSWPNPVLFFAPGGEFYAATFLDGPDGTGGTLTSEWDAQWEAAGAVAPARDGIISIERAGDAVTVVLDAEMAGDASCCPSGRVTVTVRPVDGTIELVDIALAGGD